MACNRCHERYSAGFHAGFAEGHEGRCPVNEHNPLGLSATQVCLLRYYADVGRNQDLRGNVDHEQVDALCKHGFVTYLPGEDGGFSCTDAGRAYLATFDAQWGARP